MASRVGNCIDCGAEYMDRSLNGLKVRCPACQRKHNQALAKARNAAKTATPGFWTADTLRRKYGWTPEQFDAQLALQGGGCAICGDLKPGGHGRWHVDHDHETGQVRGILCSNCNLGVGNVKDDVDLLRRMAKYLRDHQARRA